MVSPSRVCPLGVGTDRSGNSTTRPPAFGCRKAWGKCSKRTVPTSHPEPAAIPSSQPPTVTTPPFPRYTHCNVLVPIAVAELTQKLDFVGPEPELIPGPAAQALADPVWEVEDLDDEVEMSKEESDVSSVSSSSFFSEDSDVYTSPFSSCSESSVEDLTTTVFPPELTGQGVTAPSPTIRTQSRSLKILTTNFWTSVFSRFRSRARVSVLVGEADPGLEAEPAAQDVQDLEERRDAVETPPKRKGGRRKLFLSCFRGSERD
ncbi:uncharacterized protein LOC125786969 isoform X2 [Astyanax mexicanus]|uniref:uncharacterized protein LOC125786969 isoform X1 n=1 Tax=Astyanax mexicanus TaxID=7994 RepID=UPI0020CB0741|nr:uncharacterized protein LOC125786969 isoform X1 [Astyanax mexicanus]XP_049326611.1 uncharacterized protein LOC125786969 isoform X2 [Astyanax mexicanus]